MSANDRLRARGSARARRILADFSYEIRDARLTAVVADTRHNRRVLAEFSDLMLDLPRLRTSAVLKTLASGKHPETGLILI